MASLTVVDTDLRVGLSTWEQVGAMCGSFSVPLASILSVQRFDDARSAIRGIRAPGTGWPRRIALGHWRWSGFHDFVAVYRRDAGYMIELEGHRFDRIVISAPPLPELDQL